MRIEITVEGPEKCGKSALVEVIRRHLQANSIGVDICGADAGCDGRTPSYAELVDSRSTAELMNTARRSGAVVEIHT